MYLGEEDVRGGGRGGSRVEAGEVAREMYIGESSRKVWRGTVGRGSLDRKSVV